MPHLTLEYTANLEVDIQSLLADLHQALVSTGAIRIQGLKSRAVRQTDFRIADGNPEYAFVHVSLLIKPGQPQDVQAELARQVMAVLKAHLGEIQEHGYLSLSVDIKEMGQGTALTDHNIPDS
jgi:5-carboxymethyl-2-hydroxymuconate isomerase